MNIESYIDRGNSFPIIIEDQGKRYLVKLRAGMSGKYSLISEWIGNTLGRQLGIQTQRPIWIELEEAINADSIHIEVRELVQKSLGINIGFEYQKEATEVLQTELEQLAKHHLAEIFLLDLMMINIDRTARNINLMKVGKALFSVDYESSLLIQDMLTNKSLLEDQRILQCLRKNPLYQPLNEETIDAFVAKTKELSIDSLWSGIPVALLGKEEEKLLKEQFEKRKKKDWFLKEIMDKLTQIVLETAAAEKIRIRKNQAAFKRKFKENMRPKKK